MESYNPKYLCPKCGRAGGFKSWEDLNEEQKLLVERLPASAEYTVAKRKKHRFCTRCWFEETSESNELA